MMGRPAIIFMVTILFSGCHGHERLLDLGREDSNRILSSEPQTPLQFLSRGWARFVHHNDLQAALDDFRRARSDLPEKMSRARMLANLGYGFASIMRSDFPGAMLALLSALEAAPLSPESLVAADQLKELVHQVPDGHARIATRVENLLSTKGGEKTRLPGPECERELRRILLEGALRHGDLDLVRKLETEMGVPPVWQTSMLREGHPLVAFDRACEMNSLWPSRTEAMVTSLNWPVDGTLVPQTTQQASVFLARTFFMSPCREKDCHQEFDLRISSGLPWAAQLDSVQPFVNDRHRRRLPKTRRLRFSTGKGWHSIVVMAPVRVPLSAIEIEITRVDDRRAGIEWWNGKQIPAGRLSSSLAGARKSSVSASPGATDTLINETERNPGDPLAALFAALLAWHDGNLSLARELLVQARLRTPHFAMTHHMEGVMLLEDPDIPTSIDNARASEHFRRALEKCPDASLARFRLALLDARGGREEDALATLKNLQKERPSAFIWPFFRGNILRKMGWDAEAGLAYRQALHHKADNASILRKLFEMAREQDAGDSAIAFAERLETLGQLDDLASFWRERGNDERAMAILEKEVDRNPSDHEARTKLAALFFDRGNAEGAVGAMEKALSLAPGNALVLSRAANLFDALGMREEAEKIHARYVELYPWDVRYRQALALARGKSTLRLAGEKVVDAHELIERYKEADAKLCGHSVLVLDQTAIEVYADGSGVARIHQIVHVRNPEGLDRWGEINTPGEIVNELRTIKADGRVYDAEAIAGKDTVSFKALQVGDFIEIRYLTSFRRGTLEVGASGWAGHRWYFRVPGSSVFLSRYSVATPEDTRLEIDSHGEVPRPKTESTGGFEVVTWEDHELPVVPSEPLAPPADEYLPFLQTGHGVDWQDYRDILQAELLEASLPTPDLRHFIEHAIESTDEVGRLQEVFRWTCEKVRQTGSSHDFTQPANHVLARREGNRIVLLYALLRIMGHSPRVMLVRTSSDPVVEYRFPNRDVFRHGLLLAEVGDREIWLDPGDRFNAFDRLYSYNLGARALEVTSGQGHSPFVTLPASRESAPVKTIELELSLDDNGTLTGRGTERIATTQAVNYRKLLSDLNPSQRQQGLQRGLGDYFSGAILKGHSIENLSDPSRPLIIKYSLFVPAFADKQENKLIIRGGFYPYRLSRGLTPGPTRSLPLMLGDETGTRTRVSLTLPRGSSTSMPRAAEWKAPLSRFSYHATSREEKIEISKELLVQAGRIEPADYPAFRDFCQRVDRKETEEITVNLPITE